MNTTRMMRCLMAAAALVYLEEKYNLLSMLAHVPEKKQKAKQKKHKGKPRFKKTGVSNGGKKDVL